MKQLIEDLGFCSSECTHTSSQRASTTKGQSPTMRHVSRTHRVDVDLLCERIALDPGIHQIKHVTNRRHPKRRFVSLVRGGLLTHLFNLMTPQKHSCSLFYVFFPPCRTTTTCRNVRQNLFTESVTAEQRPVRNLSAYVTTGQTISSVWKNHPRQTRLGVTHATTK